jgi:hypothetical protein
LIVNVAPLATYTKPRSTYVVSAESVRFDAIVPLSVADPVGVEVGPMGSSLPHAASMQAALVAAMSA